MGLELAAQLVTDLRGGCLRIPSPRHSTSGWLPEKRLFTAASPAAHRADGCLADVLGSARPHGVCSGCQRVRWRCSVLDLSRDPLRTADCQAFAQTGRGSIQVRSVLWGHRRWATSGSPYMRASTGPDASTGVRT